MEILYKCKWNMCIFAFNFNFLKNLYFTLLFFHSICFSFFFLLTFIIFFWSCLLLVINFLQVEHFRNLLKDSPNWWKLNVSKKKIFTFMLYSKGTSCNCTIHWLTISQETPVWNAWKSKWLLLQYKICLLLAFHSIKYFFLLNSA